jgi:hypothetical protein
MAIADVYSGRRFVEMEPYLEQSLELVFRVTVNEFINFKKFNKI